MFQHGRFTIFGNTIAYTITTPEAITTTTAAFGLTVTATISAVAIFGATATISTTGKRKINIFRVRSILTDVKFQRWIRPSLFTLEI